MKQLFRRGKVRALTLSPKLLSQLWLPVVLLLSLILIVIGVLSQQFDTRNRAASHPPRGNAIFWNTNYAFLGADNFYIYANGKYYWGNQSTLTVSSDPGNPNYTTLEAIWNEDEEMRLFMYFRSDGANWWVDEIRTYNGLTPGDWITYTGRYFETPLGQAYQNQGDFTLAPNSLGGNLVAQLHLQNVRVQGFLTWQPTANNYCWNNLIIGEGDPQWPCPCCKTPPKDGLECIQILVPASCEEIALYNKWVKDGCQKQQIPQACGSLRRDFQCGNPIPTPSRCFTAVTPTFTPTQTPTPTVQDEYTLDMLPADIIEVPFNTTSNVGFGVQVLLRRNGQIVTNNSGLTYEWVAGDTQIFSVSPYATCDNGIQAPCPLNHADLTGLRVGDSYLRVTVWRSGQVLTQRSFTIRVRQTQQGAHTLEFRVKLRGAYNAAYQPFATVRFVNQSRNINIVTQPVGLTPSTNGVYRIPIQVSSNDLPSGPGYQIYIKGEKHLAKKFCADGQTTACGSNQTLSLPSFTGGTTVYDFTGVELDPGDIPPQDGRVNVTGANSDFARLWAQMNKNCADSGMTSDEQAACRAADLNYNNQVRISDSVLLIQSIAERFDD